MLTVPVSPIPKDSDKERKKKKATGRQQGAAETDERGRERTGHVARQDVGRGCNVDEGRDGQMWYVHRVGMSMV